MGGKSGGYSGPSAAEIEMQKEMYRNQWEAEQQAKKLEEEERARKEQEQKAKEELASRKGVKDVLSNSQVGFMKKINEDEDELGSVI